MSDEDVYNETLRLQLERDLDRFTKAGMDDHVAAVTERLADVPPAEDDDEEEDAFEDWTKDDLQAELEARDLPTSGNKPDLIARLKGEG